jgi:hypothetical protein
MITFNLHGPGNRIVIAAFAFIMLLPGFNFFQNVLFPHNDAYAESSNSLPFRARDFMLKYGSNPYLGIISTGQPLAVSITIQKIQETHTNAEAYYITQILDNKSLVVSLQITDVNVAGSNLIEVGNNWIPKEPGTYTISGFFWLRDQGRFATPLTDKISIKINVQPQQDVEVKTVTFCKKKCDYSYLQTAIDRNHEVGTTILIKDGDYTLEKPIKLHSNTRLEFSEKAKINFRGESGLAVFQGKNVQNVEIINPNIAVKNNSGVTAFSFNSSKMIKVIGGELRMVSGENSAGFSCRDCKNVRISNISMSTASRLIDIGTNALGNSSRSSNIWILDGKYSSASIEAIKVNYSTNVYIIGNTVSTSSDNGIDVGYSYHTLVRDNHLTNAGVPFGSAIHTDSANDVDITGNFVNGTSDNGVTVYRASNVNVYNNTIIDSNHAIAIVADDEPSSNVRVTDNHVINPRGYGIFVSSNQLKVEIIGNRMEQVAKDKAINITYPNNNAIVEGNLVF